MRITEFSHAQFSKTAGRKIRFRIFSARGPDGKLVVQRDLVDKQMLGGSCHQIQDLISGASAPVVAQWQDDPDPQDHEFEVSTIRQR